MPEEQTEVFERVWFRQDRTSRMKPVMDQIVQRYFRPEWRSMGIRFLEDSPLAWEEGERIRYILGHQSVDISVRERRVLDLRNELLWWDVEPSRRDNNRLGGYYMNKLRGSTQPEGLGVENIPPDTAAIKDIRIVPTNDDEPFGTWVFWHSFEDLKKKHRVDKIDQQTVRINFLRDTETGLTDDALITIVADPEETESFIDILLELTGAPEV